jgi:hypothetical protein
MGIYSLIVGETLTFLGRRFGLSDVPGTGITCGENGLFVGPVPLLKRLDRAGSGGRDQGPSFRALRRKQHWCMTWLPAREMN